MSRIKRLQKKFEKLYIDAFLVTDEKNIYYLTGFNLMEGDGCLLVTKDNAIIITDDRFQLALEEFANDVDAINKLYPLLVASQALTEALNDTLLALSSDAMKEADEVYGFLKIASKRDANAKALVEQIARRFKGQGKKKPE